MLCHSFKSNGHIQSLPDVGFLADGLGIVAQGTAHRNGGLNQISTNLLQNSEGILLPAILAIFFLDQRTERTQDRVNKAVGRSNIQVVTQELGVELLTRLRYLDTFGRAISTTGVFLTIEFIHSDLDSIIQAKNIRHDTNHFHIGILPGFPVLLMVSDIQIDTFLLGTVRVDGERDHAIVTGDIKHIQKSQQISNVNITGVIFLEENTGDIALISKGVFDNIKNGFNVELPNPTNEVVASYYGVKPLWKTDYSQGIVVMAEDESDYFIVMECSSRNRGYKHTKIILTMGGCM